MSSIHVADPVIYALQITPPKTEAVEPPKPGDTAAGQFRPIKRSLRPVLVPYGGTVR